MDSVLPDSTAGGAASPAPFFSIVVPCCDVAPYVAQCLESVLSQSFRDWEILAGVETSSDDTGEIVRSFAERDPRIRMFTGPRSGSCSVSRNRGVALARGRYVVFLDGDDTIAPGSLGRLRDRIAGHPGADLYPCATVVRSEATGRDIDFYDNYPDGSTGELTGPEATLLVKERANPMLQLTVFRLAFLRENALECIPGIRRQDNEFSPRALYLARRVVPLHEPFYVYRIRTDSVGSHSRIAGYFLRDWATVFRSLLAFHAAVSRQSGFDSRVATRWRRDWLRLLFFWWFSPVNMRTVPRRFRLETLSGLFAAGFDDWRTFAATAPFSKRVACRWVERFVRHPILRPPAEWFFALYFALSDLRPR